LCLAGPALGQTRFAVYTGTKKVGSATFVQVPNSVGGKSVDLTFYLTVHGEARKVLNGEDFDAAGRQLIVSLTSTLGKKKVLTGVAARISLDGRANMLYNLPGKRGRQVIEAPRGSRKNPSALWFVKTMPNVGQSVSCYYFNLDNTDWEKLTTTYTGPLIQILNGKSYSGFQVMRSSVHHRERAVYDKYGIPILLITENLPRFKGQEYSYRLERQ